jgi:hypothetical protein
MIKQTNEVAEKLTLSFTEKEAEVLGAMLAIAENAVAAGPFWMESLNAEQKVATAAAFVTLRGEGETATERTHAMHEALKVSAEFSVRFLIYAQSKALGLENIPQEERENVS